MLKAVRVKVSDVKLPSPSIYSPEVHGVTQGLLADFATCRQRVLFRINGWTKDEEDSKALYFGSLCHHILERHYKTKSKYPSALLKTWIKEYVTKFPHKDSGECSLKARALMPVYFDIYREDLKKFFPVRTEEVFDVQALGARLRGRKDLIHAYFKQPTKIWMMEHKTKSRIDHEHLSYILTFDVQNLFYDLNEKLIHGRDLSGIIYNILKTPGQRQKKNESESEYLARMSAEIRKDYKEYFFRYEVTISPEDRARFKAETKAKLDDVRAWLQAKVPHYRNESACVIPYRCKFLEACSSGHMGGYHQTKILYPELED